MRITGAERSAMSGKERVGAKTTILGQCAKEHAENVVRFLATPVIYIYIYIYIYSEIILCI